jgi:hypothetical protein
LVGFTCSKPHRVISATSGKLQFLQDWKQENVITDDSFEFQHLLSGHDFYKFLSNLTFKYNGISYMKSFMPMSCSNDGHLLGFTWAVGVGYREVCEEHTAAIFRVT